MLRRKVCASLIASLVWSASAEAAAQDGIPNTASSSTGAASAPASAAQTAQKSPAVRNADARGTHPAVTRALQALTDWVKGRRGAISAAIIDTESGAEWAAVTPEVALNPASNMKILTAAVALDRLGCDYRFSTGLYGSIEGSRVDTLVLRGHGDPSLSTAHLWQLASALAHLGVKQVGAVLVDQSRFDAQFVPPAYAQQPDEWARFRAPVSAVAVERNAVTLAVLPGAAGQSARAWFDPPGIVSVRGSIETRPAGSGEAIQLTLRSEGQNLFAELGGHVAQGLPRMRFDRRLDDPRRAPGLALRELLRDAGIEVSGDVGLGGEGVTQRLVFHQSEPLGVLVQELGKHSDNFYAEMLFKVLGAEAAAGPASSAAGARVVQEWLSARDLWTAETRIENGSGLFDANRVSAATLAGVLVRTQQNPRIFPEFLAQLAIGGVDGTLRSRFKAFKSSRRVRAKTGTLAASVSLSGYVLDAEGSAPVAFVLLVSGIEGHAAEARQHMDRVVEAVARAERKRASAP